eukprot:Awhi_evm1s1883
MSYGPVNTTVQGGNETFILEAYTDNNCTTGSSQLISFQSQDVGGPFSVCIITESSRIQVNNRTSISQSVESNSATSASFGMAALFLSAVVSSIF